MPRIDRLQQWLAQTLSNTRHELAPASADASFRRYFRVLFPAQDAPSPVAGHASLIVMDAPPEREDCRPWLAIARLFGAANVHVPEILAEDIEQGFLLISDLGDTTYLDRLRAPSPPVS